MTYKYSVISPVYNAEETLSRCIDSLISQNNSDAEIILINDGSKDQSGKICREYASKYDCIKYIEQANAGVSAARNAGLDAASGEFVTFVDSDDFVSEDYFKALDQAETDFSVFLLQTIRDDGIRDSQFSQKLKSAPNHTERVLNIIADRIAGPVAKKFRRAIIEEHHLRFKQDLTIGEDFIFGLEYMLCCASSQIVGRVVYCVDETGKESITRAARYDLSQFTRMYRYAFDIAEHCAWPQEEKDQLIQLLDYLYCRTAFARTGYCILEKELVWQRALSLIGMFRRDYHHHIQPLNIVHRIMRWCVKHRVVPVFFGVGYARILVQKVSRKYQ